MTLFHQSSPHISNQFKLFPLRRADNYKPNGTLEGLVFEENFHGISLAAILPICVIVSMVLTLVVFIQLRKRKMRRAEIARFEGVYDALETLEGVKPGNIDSETVNLITHALVMDGFELRMHEYLGKPTAETVAMHTSRRSSTIALFTADSLDSHYAV